MSQCVSFSPPIENRVDKLTLTKQCAFKEIGRFWISLLIQVVPLKISAPSKLVSLLWPPAINKASFPSVFVKIADFAENLSCVGFGIKLHKPFSKAWHLSACPIPPQMTGVFPKICPVAPNVPIWRLSKSSQIRSWFSSSKLTISTLSSSWPPVATIIFVIAKKINLLNVLFNYKH